MTLRLANSGAEALKWLLPCIVDRVKRRAVIVIGCMGFGVDKTAKIGD